MEMSWKDALKVYWPYLVLLAFNVLGGIYAAGYASGQRSILYAASVSATEVKRG